MTPEPKPRCPYCHNTGKVRFRSMATGEWETDICLNCDGPVQEPKPRVLGPSEANRRFKAWG